MSIGMSVLINQSRTASSHWISWFAFGFTLFICSPLQAGTVPNGQPCTSDSDCQSSACYPFPPYGGNICESRALNCAFPGTDGARYGQSTNINGSGYVCSNPGDGRATWLPRGKANGVPCKSATECQSGQCYPYPPKGQNYCMARENHCARPDSAGARYGAQVTDLGTVYQCVNPGSGQPATWLPASNAGIKANGVACTSPIECKSSYCYPYPPDGKNYCLSAALNCAAPGREGARYGETVTINQSTYQCSNPGKGAATWLPEGKPNGYECLAHTDCNSRSCFPYPDGKRYCIYQWARCSMPNSSGVGWNATTQVGNQSYVCTPGINWANQSCPEMFYAAQQQCAANLKIPNFCLPNFPVSTGWGEMRDCSTVSALDRPGCNVGRETEKTIGKITQLELEHSAGIARGTSKPIPPHILAQLRCFYGEDFLGSVRYTSEYSPDGRLNAIMSCLVGGSVGGLPGCLAGIVSSPAGWQDLAYYSGIPMAITFGSDIITFRIREDAENNIILWAHELEHARQYLRLGTNGFADMYTFAQGTMEFDAERKELYVCYSLAKPANDPAVITFTDCRNGDLVCQTKKLTPQYCEGLRQSYASAGHNHPVPAVQTSLSNFPSSVKIPSPSVKKNSRAKIKKRGLDGESVLKPEQPPDSSNTIDENEAGK